MITTLLSTKGGTGKSSLTIALGWELLAKKNKILIVDSDPQGTVRTCGEVARELQRPAPTIVAMGKDMFEPNQLPALAPSFDHVLIDTPGRLGDVNRAALMVSDVVLIPVGQSAADAWGVAETIALVRQAQHIRPELRAAFVVTRVLPRTTLGKGAKEALAEVGFKILSAQTTYRVSWQECVAAGQGPTQYAPKDKSALETKALLKELLAFAAPAVERKAAHV